MNVYVYFLKIKKHNIYGLYIMPTHINLFINVM